MFVDKLDDNIADLFFCCDSGESRSPALATAYMRYFGMDEMSIWRNPRYHPNSLVYKFQCKALGKPISAIGLKYRTYISKQALKKAIKRARK